MNSYPAPIPFPTDTPINTNLQEIALDLVDASLHVMNTDTEIAILEEAEQQFFQAGDTANAVLVGQMIEAAKS